MVPYYTHIVSKFLSNGLEKCEIKVYTSLNMIVHPMIVAPKASELMSWSVVRRACVRALTFSLNVFFAETTKPILMKYHRNVPANGLVSLHWLIRKIPSHQTLQYLGIGLKYKTPKKD